MSGREGRKAKVKMIAPQEGSRTKRGEEKREA